MKSIRNINFTSVNYLKNQVKYNSLFLITIFFSTLLLSSCDKQTLDNFQTEPVSNYYPMQVGKYFIYRVDSTVFTNFGRTEEIRKYQIKHTVDAQITDNLGRLSYRILRASRNETGTSPWLSSGSYIVTPLASSIEVVEENLRYIKLVQPLRDKFKWKGNKYIPTNPYGNMFNFSNDDNMDVWDYVYDGFQASTVINGKTFSNVFTVEHVNESINVPISSPTSYAALTRSVEKFSKNIGLVYREYTLWEYQPNPGGPSPYKIGFGLKMWLIDNN